jgi:hypothetical protein
MKKVLIILVIFTISLMATHDNLTARSKESPIEKSEKYKVYCEITYMPYQRIAIVNIGSTIDAIRDEEGKPKEFISILDAINYMAKFGWEIAEIYGIPKDNDKNTYYFLCKEVSNENEIAKGLNLKPLDKTFFDQIR